MYSLKGIYMSYTKQYLEDILEAIAMSDFDYESVAIKFNMTPKQVYQIALDFGDIDTCVQ